MVTLPQEDNNTAGITGDTVTATDDNTVTVADNGNTVGLTVTGDTVTVTDDNTATVTDNDNTVGLTVTGDTVTVTDDNTATVTGTMIIRWA
jgi:phage/plasmid-associated DNA primase